jgi:hypothetical protein
MANVLKAIDFLTKHRRQKKQVKNNINDLFERFHVHKNIKIPIPNLYAENRLDYYFGNREAIDFEDALHIGIILFILENQDNDILEQCSKEEIEKLGRERIKKIRMSDKESYQLAIYEMFMALKKNSVRKQKEIMQDIMEMIINSTGEK